MLVRQSPALLLVAAATAVQGFGHSSPFFMVSNEPVLINRFATQQIATAHDVEMEVLKRLQQCEHQYYFVVSQPGLTAADVRDDTSMPRIRERVADFKLSGVLEIPEVVGELDAERLAERIAQQCGTEMMEASLSDAHLSPIPVQATSAVVRLQGEHVGQGKERTDALAVQDARLDRYINNATDHKASYLVIYTAAPEVVHEFATYEMDEPFPELHTDLKRHVEARHVRRANSTDDAQAGLPLFERYQFLSPGIFMGLSVSLLLFMILYVGISAIAGLEVSYMAFSKEMGPQAQKGKQQ